MELRVLRPASVFHCPASGKALHCLLGGGIFCSHAYSSVVCYELDPWAQGQALRVFLSQKCVLPLFCQKYMYSFKLDQICQKAS